MHRKLSQARIVNDLSEVITQKLVGKCKRYLHSLPAMLSGDNSGLANVWDELCVQVQGEHSYYWDAYLETIDDFLRWPVDELPAYQLDALWLQTAQGEAWQVQEDDRRDSYPAFRGDVVVYLRHAVLKKAIDWENKRIRRYLDSYAF